VSDIFSFFTKESPFFSLNSRVLYLIFVTKVRNLLFYLLSVYNTTLGEGFLYVRGLFCIFFVDALIADDEPIWEPIE